jgi:hypothetical protein
MEGQPALMSAQLGALGRETMWVVEWRPRWSG